MRQHQRAIGAATVIAAILSGCGSSSKSSSNASSATRATSAASSGAQTAENAAPPVAVSAKGSKLGTILAAGPKRMTVYLFEGDAGSSSTCTGACTSVWPPVTGTATASAGAMSADLGTITRADGTKQVTYKGHPLYFYARDGDKGDAYGEGLKSFGSDWYVLAPSGNKVDKS